MAIISAIVYFKIFEIVGDLLTYAPLLIRYNFFPRYFGPLSS